MAYDLDHFLALPRVGSLTASPDGTTAAVTVASAAPDGTKMRTAIWEIDLDDRGAEPVRLTRSAAGESAPAYLPDGSLLFVSARPDPDAKPGGDDPTSTLWRLPAGRGEAELVMTAPAGIAGISVANTTGDIAIAVDMFPGAETLDDDAERAKARKEAGVKAQLFERLPIRFWDHYLGPRERRFFVLARSSDSATGFADPRQVAVIAGHERSGDFDLTDDGATLLFDRRAAADPRGLATEIVAVDVASGEERVLTAPDAMYAGAVADRSGRRVACNRALIPDDDAPDSTIWLIDLDSGEGRDLMPGFDLMPGEYCWDEGDEAVVFVADERGHRPAYRIAVDGSADPVRLTGDGSYLNIEPIRGTDRLVGLASALDRAHAPVTIGRDGNIADLPNPGTDPAQPGRLLDIETTADDGTTIRSWLALPDGASDDSPVPLVVWVHGGPRASWNDWMWRWNPWLLVERGYAVLMPDPALSTGYGRDFLRRGHAAWGDEPYSDVIAAVDGAVARPDIDADRTALMGGSFGGYMANWVAGHTDRFRCIVTHASLWALDQFQATTDMPPFWELEWGSADQHPERYAEHSPHRCAGAITTPMLVIHGELDHRVPIGEGLRLWTDLQRHGVESKFLYFPDENHWILKPQNARIWYETVFAWLDQYVLDGQWERPELL